MLTTARIRETVSPAGLDWISALKTADLRRLLKPLKDGSSAPLQPESLPADQVAEIVSPDFPGERLMVCLNPRLTKERARKREALLQDTEKILQGIADSVSRKGSKLRGCEQINRRVGRDANRRKVEKHFDIVVTDLLMGKWTGKGVIPNFFPTLPTATSFCCALSGSLALSSAFSFSVLLDSPFQSH